MKKSIMVLTSALLVVFLASRLDAAQLKLLLGGAVTESVRKVGAEFSHKTSHQIDVTTNTSGALQQMLRSGSKADIIHLVGDQQTGEAPRGTSKLLFLSESASVK